MSYDVEYLFMLNVVLGMAVMTTVSVLDAPLLTRIDRARMTLGSRIEL